MILEKIVCSIANDTENDPYLIGDISVSELLQSAS